MLNNYLSKLRLASKISGDVATFFKLLVNSKRYSRAYKKQITTAVSKATTYRLRYKQQSLVLCMRTFSGDIDIFYEIFWKKTYVIPENIATNFTTIVDLGAHIGLTAIDFALHYPQAKILAVEASEKNFNLLRSNTSRFSNITCIHAAAYPHNGSVRFNSDGISYNSKISDSGLEVRAISVQSLIKEHGIERINLLKIDIEGAEELLLQHQNTWLNSVDHIIIEIHAHYSINHLRRDLEPFGFTVYAREELHPELKNIFASRLNR